MNFVLDAIGENVETDFSNFVKSYPATDWIVSADFCIGINERPNDTFAYTVFPVIEDLSNLFSLLNKTIPRDLKDIQMLTPEAMEFLRAGPHFSFVFLVPKPHNLFLSVAQARLAIDATITLMSSWKDADKHGDEIDKVRRLRQEAQAKNFNVGLFSDIVLNAMCAAVVATLIVRNGKSRIIGLIPDRDKMTQAWGSIMYTMFHINLSSLCQRHELQEPKVGLGFPSASDPLRKSWIDPLIRVPDFIAGAASAMDVHDSRVSVPDVQKYPELLKNVFCDNRKIVQMVLLLQPDGIRYQFRFVSSQPSSGE